MKHKQHSIKWKLYGYLVGFVAVMIGILWMFQVVSLERFYKMIKIQSIKKSADTISKNIEHEDLETLIRQLARQNDIVIKIVDKSGNVLYGADGSPDSILTHMSRAELYEYYQALENDGGSNLKYFTKEDFMKNHGVFIDEKKGTIQNFPPPKKQQMFESILYSQLITRKDGSQVVALLNTNITPIDATVDTLRIQLIYITIILLFIAVGLALWISKKISKPIIQINESAHDLAAGKYETRFEGNGYLEIQELSNTLNYAATELSKVEGLRRELIANVSHDLKTPLTMIIGYGEMMRDLPGENTPENVQIIIDEATRLNILVNDILDLSKLQAGTMQLTMEPFNLTESIKHIMKRYEKLTEQEGYDIQFGYDGAIDIEGDEIKLTQVIYNLINNAITYTGKDKKIQVRQISSEDRVRIEVIDTGEGIEESQLPYIWERYYKVDKTHKRAAIGTGLGLSIVKNILEAHDARYGVISHVGEGSTFWFELNRIR